MRSTLDKTLLQRNSAGVAGLTNLQEAHIYPRSGIGGARPGRQRQRTAGSAEGKHKWSDRLVGKKVINQFLPRPIARTVVPVALLPTLHPPIGDMNEPRRAVNRRRRAAENYFMKLIILYQQILSCLLFNNCFVSLSFVSIFL